MEQKFYARGKLLITSEFMILHGAKALALPLRVGQFLEPVPATFPEHLHWKATYLDNPWFVCTLSVPGLNIQSTSDQSIAENLVFMLQKLLELSPGFLEELKTSDVHTELEFDPEFGFGSSSTLTSLLAQWANIDALQYHFSFSKGSGYDVACASADAPIIYELLDDMPVVESIEFRPSFSDKLWFVYLGNKQETSKSVAAFLNTYQANQQDIDFFSALTEEFIRANTLDTFMEAMRNHEQYLASLLKEQPLEEKRFPDLEGTAKSLGAWGGDFALLATPWSEDDLRDYLQQKNIDRYFNFNELVI